MDASLLLALTSLILFALVVYVALKTSINPGIIAVGVAFIFGFFVMTKGPGDALVSLSSAVMKGKPLLNAFPLSIFWLILAVAFFINIGVVNGTWDNFVKKFIQLARGNRIAIPIILALVMAVLSACGVANLGTILFMYTIAIDAAKKLNMDPIMLCAITHTGSIMGSGSPIAFGGIIANNLAIKILGFPIINELFLKPLIGGTIAVIFILVAFKAWKTGEKAELVEAEPFNRNQIITLLAFVVFLVLILFFKFEVGASAFFLSVILLLLFKSDGKKEFALVPWSTIVLVSGMVMFVSVVSAAGGITLLTSFLSKFMNQYTAKPIMVLIGALMSTVSSATGVVLPTMFPVTPGLAVTSGVPAVSLMISVLCGAFISALSPMSTVGGAALAILSQKGYDQNVMFKRLFIWAFILTGVFMVLSLVVL